MKFRFVVAVELMGLTLIAIELGILINEASANAHIFGYAGAVVLALGSFLWGKWLRGGTRE
jgi:hypothetical protein